jgi:DNA-binding transcriptional ArsR family regulator
MEPPHSTNYFSFLEIVNIMAIDNLENHKRAVLIRMILDIHGAVLAKLKEPPEVTLVLMAIRLGEMEGRPMDLKSLVAVTHYPRTSVSRHVRELMQRGRVAVVREGRRTVMRLNPQVEGSHVKPFYAHIEKAVLRASRDLTKMDPFTFDRGVTKS